VPEVLLDLGFDPTKVLPAGGFNSRMFDDIENLVSVATRGQLLAHCTAVTRCAHFGLLVGQRGHLDSFGMLGLLARYSADVQTALSSFIRHFQVHIRCASLSLTVHKESAILSYQMDRCDYAALDQISDRTMRRRLDASDTSYHKLLEEVRSDLALHLLRDSELGVSVIAQMLQYCDSRSFTRAFRRWSGETPARWRVQSPKHGDLKSRPGQ
jgi:AraC-like DNA-binding protein